MKNYHLNLKEGYDPVVLAMFDDARVPIRDTVGLLCLENTGLSRNVQVNSIGSFSLFSSRALENPNFRDLKSIIDELLGQNVIKNEGEFNLLEGGQPLIVYPSIDNRDYYSIVSFGRKFDLSARQELKVKYLGFFQAISYEDRFFNFLELH